ncbi:unnamed protein product [Spirodela intermedia]|uniref:Uncharacterized protein n=1 Tax=Spirodela intermedia TaxID=51605 RepID=A0ABN7E8F7_SPIIN|nr:unnamed protein product [Spirodela intermedia]
MTSRRLFTAFGTLLGDSDSSPDESSSSQRRLVPSPFLAHCMTTPCPIVGWPPMTWKGGGAHVPLSVQATQAPAHGYSLIALPTCLWA